MTDRVDGLEVVNRIVLPSIMKQVAPQFTIIESKCRRHVDLRLLRATVRGAIQSRWRRAKSGSAPGVTACHLPVNIAADGHSLKTNRTTTEYTPDGMIKALSAIVDAR